MLPADFQPITTVPTVQIADGIRFLAPDRHMDVKGEVAEKIWKMLAECNGVNTLSEVARRSKLSAKEISEGLDTLVSAGLVSDSRNLYQHLHHLGDKPLHYKRELSWQEIREQLQEAPQEGKTGERISAKPHQGELEKLLVARKSCRSFEDESISAD